MRQLDAAQVEPLLDAQQPPVDERRQRVGRGARGGEGARRRSSAMFSRKPESVEQLVLDDPAHGRRLVRQRALVEIAEDGVARAGQQVQRDLVASLARCACR